MASMKKLLPLFLVVVENAARWKSVGLSLPRDYLVHAWYLTQEKVRNVESFDIDDTSIPLLGRPTGPLFMQDSVAESLSTLSVRAELCYPSSMAVPLMRLQTLSLKHTSPVRCLDLLKYCPVLENLNLHFYDAPVSIIPFEHPTILVPELRTFHLSHTRSDHNADISFVMDHGGGISSLLDYLQLPHLQEFYLWTTIMGSARFDDSKMPWDYLSRLITRSNCSLSRLEIYSPHIDTPSTLECLRLSPDLKYLGVPADKELERKVSELLPGLETLHIFK
ncbi:hypothetical protein BD410DRAFT_846462 [Rickenella mellea]|uniref:F-box domain-containing protein n=1 Tax=Rickenella mellea TaxID=50990 RepID=A0A4Y7PF62_9AGAM|nr:hypothetical protein BD410DRAFT_846462 [Rickenella mellea]